jgi:hypothetical protein
MDLGATDRMGQAAFCLRKHLCCQSWVALRTTSTDTNVDVSVGLPAAGGVRI